MIRRFFVCRQSSRFSRTACSLRACKRPGAVPEAGAASEFLYQRAGAHHARVCGREQAAGITFITMGRGGGMRTATGAAIGTACRGEGSSTVRPIRQTSSDHGNSDGRRARFHTCRPGFATCEPIAVRRRRGAFPGEGPIGTHRRVHGRLVRRKIVASQDNQD